MSKSKAVQVLATHHFFENKAENNWRGGVLDSLFTVVALALDSSGNLKGFHLSALFEDSALAAQAFKAQIHKRSIELGSADSSFTRVTARSRSLAFIWTFVDSVAALFHYTYPSRGYMVSYTLIRPEALHSEPKESDE